MLFSQMYKYLVTKMWSFGGNSQRFGDPYFHNKNSLGKQFS